MNPERVFELVRKELRQVFRDPRMRRVIFVAPMIQLVAFGYAVSTDVRDTDLGGGRRPHPRLAGAGGRLHRFRLLPDRGGSRQPADLVEALDHGDAVLGIVIPTGFSRDLEGSGPARMQLLFDGTDSNTATVARGYAERIVQSYAVRHAPAQGLPPAVDLRSRAWFNPELASRVYNVPAVIGALLMLICLLLTSLAVVREREIGTLEQLLVSPLHAGRADPRQDHPLRADRPGGPGARDHAGAALVPHSVPGKPLLLLLASVLYILSALGIGLLISTISSTQQEAFMAVFLVFLPSILLSGFMFPVTSMPEVFRWLTLINPLRHYLEIVRAIFLKGAGFAALWPQFLALALMSLGILWLASARFRRAAAG